MCASYETVHEEQMPAVPGGSIVSLHKGVNVRRISGEISEDLGLHVVPVGDVLPHERYNSERVDNLMDRIKSEARLINPPIVAAYAGRYIVLDGATRVTAFRRLGYPSIIVQVVDLQTHRVRLDTWQHTIHGGSTADLLAMLESVPGLGITQVNPSRLLGRTPVNPGIGFLLTPDGRGFLLEALSGRDAHGTNDQHANDQDDEDWLTIFNRVVDHCGAWGRIERTLSTDMDALRAHYPELAGHFVFHGFETEEVLALAAAGRTVPAGITRFVIPGRILRLNAPLERLKVEESPAAKRAWLNELLTQKITHRQMRYYEEPVILLDE